MIIKLIIRVDIGENMLKKLLKNTTENISLPGILIIILLMVFIGVVFVVFPAVAVFALLTLIVSAIFSFVVFKIIILPAESEYESKRIAKLIKRKSKKCTNIYIMGHKRPDFDSFGACMGVYSICKRYNDNTKVIVGQDRFAIKEIYDKFIFGGYEDAFIDVFATEQAITKEDLIILCDTHSARIVESSKAFAAAGCKIVIDHHRENEAPVEDCDKMFVFPEYSSCCEMVTSVMMNNSIEPTYLYAEALLAGIMVDTRNFGVNCDENTFEAGAFLCKCGADTVDARNLFKSSMELERAKANAVEGINVYKDGIVFSVCESNHKNVYLACARAADELLEIKGVEASVVLCQWSGVIYVSARSNGNIDVNNILKKVGGGGHITTAGAQLNNIEITEAETLLKQAVDEYLLEVERK